MSHIKQNRCLNKVIHQIDSKDKCLRLVASFTAKFELVLISLQENAFS